MRTTKIGPDLRLFRHISLQPAVNIVFPIVMWL